ncbi:MAG: hypothetical protein GY874_12470 [Desulfobacteraceae bacterium]|nr:hypothetical protein [Desulfobacteraceae bacterium]
MLPDIAGKVFSAIIFDEMKSVFEKGCLDFEVSLEEFDCEKDHVRLLILYPPKVSVSTLVNSLLSVFPFYKRNAKSCCITRLKEGVLYINSIYVKRFGN